MSKTKFTPGPWIYVGDAIMRLSAGSPDKTPADFVIAEIPDYRQPGYPPDGLTVMEANGCLIAAAPELYEALAGLVVAEDAGTDTGAKRAAFIGALRKARAALAKARGEG